MMDRIRNRMTFHLERLILRGAHYRLLLIAAIIGLVSAGAGIFVFRSTTTFSSFSEAIWWAFLRLTDPGYLGDDKGLVLGTASTIVTVLGYVLFMGSLIAIMTQWLNETMRTLEKGLTPIAQNNHVLILGWTNRTPTIVHELVLSEGRVKRFLRRHGARKLHIVILLEEVTTERRYELRDYLGEEQNVRHRWLSYIYSELLTHGEESNEIYIRACSECEGIALHDLTDAFPKAILLGVMRCDDRGVHPLLNPPVGFVVSGKDRLVLIARSYKDSQALPDYTPRPVKRGAHLGVVKIKTKRRVLLMGWNNKVPALIHEFDNYENEHFDVDILSTIPTDQRAERIARYAL